MPRVTLEKAYPGIAFRPRTRNWWAKLTRVPPECVHLENEQLWMATLIPDTLYLRGRAVIRGPGETPRPEVSLCRSCLIDVLESELASYTGRMVACEPDAENFSQYFFVASGDFEAAGLQPETATAISQCLARPADQCAECSRAATWLWLTREEVASLDDSGSITSAPGRRLCAAHGAATLCDALGNVPEANLFYVNVPYGEAGAYLWI